MKAKAPEIYEDKWVRTMCGRCYAVCGIRVHVINGVAVKIEGEPDSCHGSSGGLCGKDGEHIQAVHSSLLG